jgi:phage-related protein
LPQLWTIEDYQEEDGTDPVAAYVASLTSAERGRVKTRLTILAQQGLSARKEYIKNIRGKIWELRFPNSQNNPRILFFAIVGRRIVLLHGFSKTGKATDKVPEREIKIAEERMEAFLEREDQ